VIRVTTRGAHAGWGWGVWLGVAVGGAIGSILRLAADTAVPAPWDLVLVNALGAVALLVLVLAVWPRRPGAPRWLRDGIGTGVIGAFTTLSGISIAIAVATPVPVIADPGTFLAAAAAGTLGTLIRHAAAISSARLRVSLGILIVNVLGSFLAGLALAALARGAIEPSTAIIVVAGGCGGLTTFSTIVADAVRGWPRGDRWLAALVLAANLGLGALAAWWGAVIL